MIEPSNEVSAGFVPRLGLFVARFCASAWVGAATLFVIVGVIEVTRGGFDSATKDQLVTLRFPAYYVCGSILICLGWLGSLAAGSSPSFPARSRIVSLILLATTLILMAVDYVWIYQPLVGMVDPPGQTKPANFRSYHEASKYINFAELGLCLIATTLLSWPRNKPE